METLIKFKRSLTWQILVTAAAVAAGMILFGWIPAAKGFVLGSFFSLINFHLMVRQAPGKLHDDHKVASAKSFVGLVLRLGVLALPLYLASRSSELSLVWTAVGIFNLQISIILNGLVRDRLLAAGSSVQGR